MRRLHAAAGLVALLTACGPSPKPVETAANSVAIIGATLIDGSGAGSVPDSVVVVREGRIWAAGPKASTPVPEGSQHVDASGRFLIPGLMDLHVHLGSTGGPGFRAADYTRERVLQNLNSYLYFGVTTVRSIGTERDAGLQIRDEQRSGPVTTARLYTAGRGFTAPGGHPAQEIGDIARQPKDAADARHQVNVLAGQHVDAIKIWIDDLHGQAPKVSQPVIEAILDEAAKVKIPVSAHISSLADTMHFFDHGGSGFLHMVRDTETLPAEFVTRLHEKQTVFTPTLIRQELAWYYKDKPERLNDPDLARLVSPATLDAMKNAVAAAQPSPAARAEFAVAMRNTKRMADAGVPIATGSDGGSQMDVPGLMTLRECELLVEAGFTPLQAIAAATHNAAVGLGKADELGMIAGGQRADLVLLSADPTRDIRNLRAIDRIMLDGRWVARQALSLR